MTKTANLSKATTNVQQTDILTNTLEQLQEVTNGSNIASQHLIIYFFFCSQIKVFLV